MPHRRRFKRAGAHAIRTRPAHPDAIPAPHQAVSPLTHSNTFPVNISLTGSNHYVIMGREVQNPRLPGHPLPPHFFGALGVPAAKLFRIRTSEKYARNSFTIRRSKNKGLLPASKNDCALPATLGDVAERACRLQERRSLLETGSSQTGVLQTGFTVATEPPPDHRAWRPALRSSVRPVARRSRTAP